MKVSELKEKVSILGGEAMNSFEDEYERKQFENSPFDTKEMEDEDWSFDYFENCFFDGTGSYWYEWNPRFDFIYGDIRDYFGGDTDE